MRILKKIVVLTSTMLLLASCAMTGDRVDWSDWRNCMVAGATAGALVGVTDDVDHAAKGVAIGAVIGSLYCAMTRNDEDGDGVSDDDDRCPGTFAGAEVDQNGCELDFDGDGVVDRLDECPDTPSGARVDSRGCELDSDGDGVVNSKDQCPNTPAGASVDANGCELDDDNDGVGNSSDKCPDTAPGQAVDNTGCDLAEHFVLSGIFFEYDSAEITAGSRSAVNDAMAILKRHPELEVEIAGHTDNKGSESYNQGLSERRAGAVRAALVEGGIDASRLTVKGYGESQPVADNDSDAGRAKNRRVEFRHE